MAKFGCTCGHVIRDQTDNLPYKAELYVHQDWHAIWDYWEKHLLPLMRAGQDESQTFVDPAFPGVGLTASELKDRIWDYLIAPRTTWARTAYECEQCGRVWIQPDPDKNAYVSYLPETEKRGVLRGKAQLDGRYPMMAVVSLLDERHDLQVRALWGELARDFGPRRVTEIVRDPHVTYQGAEDYDLDRLDTALCAVAAATAPFTISTTGLGIFTGPQPVLYLAVVRSAALTTFHTALWDAIGTAGRDYSPLYAPAGPWTPHITLAQWDLTPENIGPIAARLATRPLGWEIPIDNLAVLRRPSLDIDRYEVWRRYPFAATAP